MVSSFLWLTGKNCNLYAPSTFICFFRYSSYLLPPLSFSHIVISFNTTLQTWLGHLAVLGKHLCFTLLITGNTCNWKDFSFDILHRTDHSLYPVRRICRPSNNNHSHGSRQTWSEIDLEPKDLRCVQFCRLLQSSVHLSQVQFPHLESLSTEDSTRKETNSLLY